MEIKSKTISVDAIAIETGLWHIQRYLMQRYGTDESYRDMAPLSWYIYTDRASLDFIRKVLTAKPFMIARKLHLGGSYDEAIQRIKDYVGYEDKDYVSYKEEVSW